MEEIWAVVRSVRGKDLLGGWELGITNPSLTISSSLAPCLHSTLRNEPRWQPEVSALSYNVCHCDALYTPDGSFPLQGLGKGSKWGFWKLNTVGEAKPGQPAPVTTRG